MDWIYWIKLTHTLIFFFASACILYVVYCGVVDKANNYLWSALGIVFLIGLVYAANGFECPLATLVHQLAGRRNVPDIFFPDWFANKIMAVSTLIYLVGVALVSRNLYRDRKSNKGVNGRIN
jgi:predicted Na+-dependent transporter